MSNKLGSALPRKLLPLCAALALAHVPVLSQEALLAVTPAAERSIAEHLTIAERALELEAEWQQGRWQQVVARADAMIARRQSDHRGYALRYLAVLQLKKSRSKALRYAVGASRALAEHPLELVGFIEKGLYVDARREEFQQALMALVPILGAGRKVARIRVAHLRALDGCSTVQEAAAMNKTIVEDLQDDWPGLLQVVETICDMKEGAALRGIARQAVELVPVSDRAPITELYLRFRVLHDLIKDEEAAADLGKIILARIQPDNLNDWLWNLMTSPQSAGKYRALVLQAARRMESTRARTHHEYDTMALAFYRNGLIDKAIELERRAIEAPDARETAEYRDRLAAYLAAKSGGKNPVGTSEHGAALPEESQIHFHGDTSDPTAADSEAFETEGEGEGSEIDGRKAGEWTFKWPSGATWAVGKYSSGQKTGLWRIFYETGEKHHVGAYKNGQHHGQWAEFHRNGKRKQQGEYVDGLGQGPHSGFYANGRLKAVGSLVESKPHGRWEHYYDNGNKFAIGPYKAGERHGKWEEYYLNGQLRRRAAFVDGKIEGAFEGFYAHGALESKGRMDQRGQQGTWRLWDQGGHLQREVQFVDGVSEGTYTTWKVHPNGGEVYKFSTGTYRKGRIEGVVTGFHPNGAVHSRGPYRDGYRSGAFELFNPDGTRNSSGTMRNGGYHGTWTFWAQDEKVGVYKQMAGEYQNNRQSGRWRYFYPSGQTSAEGELRDGKRQGSWLSYYVDGNLKERSDMVDDVWHGAWAGFDAQGRLESKGPMVRGKMHGTWTFYQFDPTRAKAVKHKVGAYEHGYENGRWDFFRTDGSLEERGHYRLGQQHGVFESYNKIGQLVLRREFSDNIRAGKWFNYYDDGTPSEYAEFLRGKHHGTTKRWHKNGQMSMTRQWRAGVQMGEETRWHDNGQRAVVGSVEAGKSVGVWTSWYANGQLMSIGNYTRGLRHGIWTYWTTRGGLDWRKSGEYFEGKKFR